MYEEQEFLTTKETCTYIRCTRTGMTRLMSKGLLVPIRHSARKWVFKKTELDAYLQLAQMLPQQCAAAIANLSLTACVEQTNATVRDQGKYLITTCPGCHADNCLISPDRQRFLCKACFAAGDVVDFLALQQRTSRVRVLLQILFPPLVPQEAV